ESSGKRFAALLPGLAALGAIAALAAAAAATPQLTRLGIGTLTLAIALGMLGGNLVPARWAHAVSPGAMFSQRTLLRLGVGLYGLRLTAQQIGAVGLRGVLIDLLVIASTLGLALWAGVRWFKLDRDTALLVGTGSAICGAAAVMAAEPVVRAPPHKVAIAVATVTVFGSLSILVYPLLFPLLGLDASQFGIYIGSTVHEVAQVVAAGKAVSPAAADQAVVVKLIRVALLAPVMLLLGRLVGAGKNGATAARPPLLPWFIGLFVAAAALNSLGLVAGPLHAALLQLDSVLLALAMAALGWSSSVRQMRQAGFKPLLLGALLFGFLLVGGYAINRLVTALLV
ncbi:MAG TPA: YeiH family protein, partial [Nevskia sp.]|nr:YeiH family protein [Nevskia sp.]